MENNYLSLSEIKQLKSDLLMPKKSKKSNKSFTSSVSGEFYKMRNKEIGEELEDNIRNVLEIYYGWKKVSLNRKFIYCEIFIDKKIEILTSLKEEEIIIEGQSVYFKINKNKSLEILANGNKQRIKSQKQTKVNIFGQEVIINGRKDLELDGIYEQFNFDEFDENEITYLYSNTNNLGIESFDKLVLEVKLNRDKICDLLFQLIRDKKILENFSDDKILYVGIINAKSVNFQEVVKFQNDHEDLNFILIGINNNKIHGKDIRKFHDWDEIVQNIENQIRIKSLEDKLDVVISLLKRRKNNPALKKKRKRQKCTDSDNEE